VKSEDFDYDLPGEFIAQTPARPRDSSRLMVLNRGNESLTHAHFHDLGRFLNPSDILVLNQTLVIPARLYAYKLPGGGRVELLLLRKEAERTWEILVGGKKVGAGRRLCLEPKESLDREPDPAASQSPTPVLAEVVQVLDGPRRLVQFSEEIEPLLDQLGDVPTPPYIRQSLEDPADYQTVYARQPGSVAAPTAGLHFTPGLIEDLTAKGVRFAYLTLHIGLDTFAPVTEDTPEGHLIHREWCRLDAAAAEMINSTRANGGRVVAVGTTSVRTLETAARLASPGEVVAPFEGQTDLFILPGYGFQAVDALVTNFHLPRSTLLMLVSAFAGREYILNAYETAKDNHYRFYSFGDAMLIL
jgi:S-adenosylmethionine:tRNA ribosyltransferase-isomerase